MTTQNRPDRRAMLCALAGTPFLAGTVAAAIASPAQAAPVSAMIDTLNRSAWDRAFRKMQQADTASDLALARMDGTDASAEAADAACDALATCRSVVMATPAPDSAALLWKLEHLFGGPLDNEPGDYAPSYHRDWMVPVIADARRLLGGRAL